MINGKNGRLATIYAAVALVILVVARAGLIAAHYGDAARSLDEVITLLTGLIFGSVGLNPYVNIAPPLVSDSSSLSEQIKANKAAIDELRHAV